MFKLMGDSEADAENAAGTILEIETRLAKASNTRLENRDPHATYNKTTLKKLDRQTRHFDWPGYFAAIGKAEVG